MADGIDVVSLSAAVGGLVVAIIAIIGYLDSRKNIKLLSKGVEALAALAENQKMQLGMAAQQGQRAAVHQQQQMTLQQQQMNWNILAGIGKALGWAIDRGFFDAEEEDD